MAYHKIDWEIISDRFKRVKDCAEEWGISKRRVQIYCEEDRIEGAFKCGQYWLIPKEAQKPPEKDYLKTKKLFIEYCDTLLHDSKTAGKTIAESVENVFGKNSGIEPHTYDLTKEGEAIAISANGGAGFHHKILIKGNKEVSGLNHKTSKEYVSDLYSPGVLGKMPKDNPSKPVIISGEINGHKYVAVSYRDHISGYHDEGIGQGFTLYSAKGGDLTPAQQDLLSIGEKLTEEDLSPHMFAISQDSNYDAILSLVQTLAQKYKA